VLRRGGRTALMEKYRQTGTATEGPAALPSGYGGWIFVAKAETRPADEQDSNSGFREGSK